MSFRKKMSRRSSRRLFKKTANRYHKKNRLHVRIRRGGIRL